MKKQDVVGIILAAGQGKRMKTTRPKVAHSLLGRPLIEWSMSHFVEAGVADLSVVVSPSQPDVHAIVEQFAQKVANRCRVRHVFQDVALGTGHAALCGVRALETQGVRTGTALIGLGDVPGVLPEILNGLLTRLETDRGALTVLAFDAENPTGYGRVLKTMDGQVYRIQEEKDCSAEQRLIRSCNSGFFAADFQTLCDFLPQIKPENAAREYYLTDLPVLLTGAGRRVTAFEGVPEETVLGINSQHQLADVAARMQRRIVQQLMAAGVQILNPEHVYIEDSVVFGQNVIVEPFVSLSGHLQIPDEARVPAFSRWTKQSDVRL
ncbi:MAG: bifunctional N-acetylglucosamine-phosphate uridyltransferase/glucosamine-phosphate [Pseudomonadota bacterium]|jgi:bifunctional UDP-N-acetylglucosamine pyrophosphorylase/glucosamine-1-phosphate N-acetyltransferase